jgi:hypothetical protein
MRDGWLPARPPIAHRRRSRRTTQRRNSREAKPTRAWLRVRARRSKHVRRIESGHAADRKALQCHMFGLQIERLCQACLSTMTVATIPFGRDTVLIKCSGAGAWTMDLTEHDDWVGVLATDRSDQNFRRRAFCQGDLGAISLSRIPSLGSPGCWRGEQRRSPRLRSPTRWRGQGRAPRNPSHSRA